MIDLAELTLALCAIPSVTGDEAAIAIWVADWAASHVPEARLQRCGNSLVIGHPPKSGLPTICLFGHLDTVKPAIDQPLVIRGDRLFGCGASDMKGGLAVMLALLARWEAFDRANACFVFYDREEGAYDDNGLVPLLSASLIPAAQLAICLEPTDHKVQVGCVGGLHAEVTFLGRRAHSARPWQGENALHKAAPLLSRLVAMEQAGPREVRFGDLTYYEVVSATMAQMDNSRNVVPDRFVLNLNSRFAPGKPVETAKCELLALVGDQAQVRFVDVAPAGAVCLENSWFDAWRKERGLAIAPKQAWTDVARLSVSGFDAVNYGPGETAQAHQANESCSIAALGEAYQHLLALFQAAPR